MNVLGSAFPDLLASKLHVQTMSYKHMLHMYSLPLRIQNLIATSVYLGQYKRVQSEMAAASFALFSPDRQTVKAKFRPLNYLELHGIPTA